MVSREGIEPFREVALMASLERVALNI